MEKEKNMNININFIILNHLNTYSLKINNFFIKYFLNYLVITNNPINKE